MRGKKSQKTPCTEVETFSTDHLPFLTAIVRERGRRDSGGDGNLKWSAARGGEGVKPERHPL